jgi:integrase
MATSKKELVTLSKTKGAVLRKRKLASGKWTIFIDYTSSKPRHIEYLDMFLTGNKRVDVEIEQLAIKIFTTKILEMQASPHGVVRNKLNTDFIQYFASQKRQVQPRKNCLSFIKSVLGEQLPFSKLDTRTLVNLREEFIANYTHNTASIYFSVVRATVKKAFDEDIIPKNIAAKVPSIRPTDGDTVYLTLAEVQKLSKTPFPTTYPKFGGACKVICNAFLFSCFAGGLRYSDLMTLSWNDIQNDVIAKLQYKTNHKVLIPLTDTAKSFLIERDNSNESIFPLPCKQTTNAVLKRWAKSAGIEKNIHIHVARHTFGTLALNAGIDIYTVSKIMGHSSIKMTEKYAKLLDKSKHQAMLKMPSL